MTSFTTELATPSVTDERTKTPVTLVPEWVRMPSEWNFVVHSWTIELYFKSYECILCAFQIFGHILVTDRNVLHVLKTFEVHSKWRNIERHSKCIPAALWLLSKYSYSISTEFHTFSSHSRRIEIASHFESCPNVPTASRMNPECTSNACW